MSDEKMKALKNLKTARGQIDGIIKMIEDERYCIDISAQIISCQGLLKGANLQVLKGHLSHCVMDAIENGDQTKEKIEEINTVIQNILK